MAFTQSSGDDPPLPRSSTNTVSCSRRSSAKNLTSSSAPGVVTATLGGLVVVLEGIQQLYQWQTNWVLYRSTHESLNHEKFLYLAKSGPYSGSQRHRVLAERVEGLVSQEHAKWTEGRHQTVDDTHLPQERT